LPSTSCATSACRSCSPCPLGSSRRASGAQADDPRLYAREYDAAYVLTHFFAYLGRDPGPPPDTGFDFRLNILERTTTEA
jgi:hypothetical protein